MFSLHLDLSEKLSARQFSENSSKAANEKGRAQRHGV